MHLTVKQSKAVQGTVMLPGSKSQSIRGMLFALMAKGESKLMNVLDSEDTRAAISVCEALSAEVNFKNNALSLDSSGMPLTNVRREIHTGNSGITTRFILPILGLRSNENPILVSCGEQMRARPIQSLIYALRNLGMSIQYVERDNCLPVLVSGRLKGGETVVDGITSQYLSALLIALPCAEKDSVIKINNLHERPYIEMTLAWLQQQKIKYTHQRHGETDTFYVQGRQCYSSFHTTINGDFSAASCVIAAAAILPGEVELRGLDYADPQGDKRLLNILQEMGADIAIEKEKIKIKGNQLLKGIRIDANDIPDLVPALAVIGCCASGKTEIYNVRQARIKETDRIQSMTEGLRQMGANITEHADGMTIYQSALHGGFVKGCNDHRTVMALTVAGMIARGTTIVTDSESINKTYPQFAEVMQSIGANIGLHKTASEQHIILIGFKHVGKTRIGQQLAKYLHKNFIDLDCEIERLYEKKYQQPLTCRQMMQLHGESLYRELESEALQHVLQFQPSVISLGGGSVISECNQAMIKAHHLIHVIAPRGIVFERIMVAGRPAFFDSSEDPYESFSRLWDTRQEIYNKLTTFSVNNNDTVEQAVVQVLSHLRQQDLSYHA